jgi:hypothetical protein
VLALAAPLLGLSLGAALALGARPEDRDEPFGEATLAAASVGLFAFAPALGALALGWEDWALGYVLPQLPGRTTLVLVWVLAAGALVPAGLRVALFFGGARRHAVAVAAACLTPLLALAGLLGDRVVTVGAAHERTPHHNAEPLWASPLGAALVLAATAIAAAAWWTSRDLARSRRGGPRTEPARLGGRGVGAAR